MDDLWEAVHRVVDIAVIAMFAPMAIVAGIQKIQDTLCKRYGHRYQTVDDLFQYEQCKRCHHLRKAPNERAISNSRPADGDKLHHRPGTVEVVGSVAPL